MHQLLLLVSWLLTSIAVEARCTSSMKRLNALPADRGVMVPVCAANEKTGVVEFVWRGIVFGERSPANTFRRNLTMGDDTLGKEFMYYHQQETSQFHSEEPPTTAAIWLDTGRRVVAWASYDDYSTTSNLNWWGQVLNEDGSNFTHVFSLHPGCINGSQSDAKLAPLPGGRFLVYLLSNHIDHKFGNAYAHMFYENGTKCGPQFQAITPSVGPASLCRLRGLALAAFTTPIPGITTSSDVISSNQQETHVSPDELLTSAMFTWMQCSNITAAKGDAYWRLFHINLTAGLLIPNTTTALQLSLQDLPIDNFDEPTGMSFTNDKRVAFVVWQRSSHQLRVSGVFGTLVNISSNRLVRSDASGQLNISSGSAEGTLAPNVVNNRDRFVVTWQDPLPSRLIMRIYYYDVEDDLPTVTPAGGPLNAASASAVFGSPCFTDGGGNVLVIPLSASSLTSPPESEHGDAYAMILSNPFECEEMPYVGLSRLERIAVVVAVPVLFGLLSLIAGAAVVRIKRRTRIVAESGDNQLPENYGTVPNPFPESLSKHHPIIRFRVMPASEQREDVNAVDASRDEDSDNGRGIASQEVRQHSRPPSTAATETAPLLSPDSCDCCSVN